MSRLLLLLFVSVALVIAVLLLWSSAEAWSSSRRLSSALRDAQNVTFVEFTRGLISGELVFRRVTASPEDIARLKSATTPWFAVIPPWKAMCFTPHHRIEIVRADRSEMRFEVCFLCHNFTFDKEPENTLPGSWQSSLAAFFTSVGMPPRTYEEYQDLAAKHPDHDLLDKELRDIDRQLDKDKAHP